MVAVLRRCRWGRLCFGGVGGAVWSHGCCGRRRPRPPARLGGLTSFGAAPRSPARPRRRPWARSQAVPTRWPGSETAIAFAGTGRASTETVIAFAGAKWVFLVQFSGAVVMSVSVVRRRGCAVVLLVSMSPWCRAWCAKKFARRRCVIAKVRKSSPSTLKLARNWCFCACWASFFTEEPLEGLFWASFFAPIGPVSVLDAMRCTFQGGCDGGFAPCEAL